MFTRIRSIAAGVCVVLGLVIIGVLIGESGCTAQNTGTSGNPVEPQSHWCRRLARKCHDGVDAACVAWGDYCSRRARSVSDTRERYLAEPPEVRRILGDKPKAGEAGVPPINTPAMSGTCRRLHSLCKSGNHTACRQFAGRCVPRD